MYRSSSATLSRLLMVSPRLVVVPPASAVDQETREADLATRPTPQSVDGSLPNPFENPPEMLPWQTSMGEVGNTRKHSISYAFDFKDWVRCLGSSPWQAKPGLVNFAPYRFHWESIAFCSLIPLPLNGLSIPLTDMIIAAKFRVIIHHTIHSKLHMEESPIRDLPNLSCI
ncbi:uncharacterized protein LAESUDRAFT_723760 [Laetiporus sulphureus 93-53]|uniref:Uncharacterized protein n=1 Tax=Laetiporus sulphureus 93-53 TaxID=1314785 RepID=A0A165FDQ3_9APHY|nr:uncharacterized protein LAESUDRAFT_723760 [Laetiporus sulphureus 93-53]KZT08814.1 hypothetical protein LAESUDRAFT_723760 [Laetiporus sulphureus 93-53]